jgi:hypothetical protein
MLAESLSEVLLLRLDSGILDTGKNEPTFYSEKNATL